MQSKSDLFSGEFAPFAKNLKKAWGKYLLVVTTVDTWYDAFIGIQSSSIKSGHQSIQNEMFHLFHFSQVKLC